MTSIGSKISMWFSIYFQYAFNKTCFRYMTRFANVFNAFFLPESHLKRFSQSDSLAVPRFPRIYYLIKRLIGQLSLLIYLSAILFSSVWLIASRSFRFVRRLRDSSSIFEHLLTSSHRLISRHTKCELPFRRFNVEGFIRHCSIWRTL